MRARGVVAVGLALVALSPLGCAAPTSQVQVAHVTSASVPVEPASAAPSNGSPVSAPPPDDQVPREGEPPAKRSRNLRNAGWASIAVGGSAAVFAIASSVVMLHDASERSSDCNAAKECSSAGLSANAQVGNNAVTNAALWTLAITGLGLGTFFVLTNPPARTGTSEKTGSTGIGVAPNGSGGSLILRGSF